MLGAPYPEPWQVTQHNVEALLTISEYYQVGFLKHACEDGLLHLTSRSQNLGYLFGGPHKKDYSISGSIYGVPIFRETTLLRIM